MEPVSKEYDVHGPNGGDQWYQTEGIDAKGTTSFINFFVKDKSEVASLAHGLGVAKSISCHGKAAHIGTRTDYNNGVAS